MTVIDMTNLETRKRVIAISGYYALRLQLRTGLGTKMPLFRSLHFHGFTSKTKKAMFKELAAFLDLESDFNKPPHREENE